MAKQINKTQSLDPFDMIDYGIKHKEGFMYILVVTDDFSKYAWEKLTENVLKKCQKIFWSTT